MSLEAQLQQLNETLERGCALLEKLIEAGAPVTVSGAPVTVSGKAEKPKDKKPKDKKPKAEKPQTEKPAEEPAGEPEEEEVIDYDEVVKPRVQALAKTNRDAVVGILSRFGCKKATELESGQYAEFLARLDNAVKNGLESDSDFEF